MARSRLRTWAARSEALRNRGPWFSRREAVTGASRRVRGRLRAPRPGCERCFARASASARCRRSVPISLVLERRLLCYELARSAVKQSQSIEIAHLVNGEVVSVRRLSRRSEWRGGARGVRSAWSRCAQRRRASSRRRAGARTGSSIVPAYFGRSGWWSASASAGAGRRRAPRARARATTRGGHRRRRVRGAGAAARAPHAGRLPAGARPRASPAASTAGGRRSPSRRWCATSGGGPTCRSRPACAPRCPRPDDLRRPRARRRGRGARRRRPASCAASRAARSCRSSWRRWPASSARVPVGAHDRRGRHEVGHPGARHALGDREAAARRGADAGALAAPLLRRAAARVPAPGLRRRRPRRCRARGRFAIDWIARSTYGADCPVEQCMSDVVVDLVLRAAARVDAGRPARCRSCAPTSRCRTGRRARPPTSDAAAHAVARSGNVSRPTAPDDDGARARHRAPRGQPRLPGRLPALGDRAEQRRGRGADRRRPSRRVAARPAEATRRRPSSGGKYVSHRLKCPARRRARPARLRAPSRIEGVVTVL